MLEAIAITITNDFGVRTVDVNAGRETGRPNETVVALGASRRLGVEGPGSATLIDVSAGNPESLPGLIRDDAAAISRIQVELTIRSGHERMERVIVILSAEACQEDFLFVHGGIELPVAINVRKFINGRGVGNINHIVKYRDTKRGRPVFVLDKRADGIRKALTFGIAKNDHLVASSPALAADIINTVVDALIDPEATLRIEIDIRGIRQHRRASPNRNL